MIDSIPNLENLKGETLTTNKTGNKLILIILVVVAVGLGIFSGYYFSGKKLSGKTSQVGITGVVPSNKIAKDAEFGVKDTGNADSATGVLEQGGLDGEGTHKLTREGGISQTVYMISSVLDLDQFSGKKIQVWGDTQKAQKAGWLMDVIKVKILE